VPRNDPTDTGGLFIGRRPGTGPLHYRGTPESAGERRRRADGVFAGVLLALETFVCLTLWGPQPVAWLWVGSQVNYWTGSVSAGIAVAFAGMIATLMLTLGLATRMDRVWRLLRRAAGRDQREGMLPRIFTVTAIVALAAFGLWFFILNGPAPPLPAQ
jgi:Kef-type K+ transport system membrane component KefB